MRPLSESASRIAKKNFSRKYIALGRLLEQWNEIMGTDFADKAQPLKIHYKKTGKNNKRPTAVLEISTSASNATILNYQKGLIQERINNLFGNNWITDIRFVVSKSPEVEKVTRKIKPPLTNSEKKYLSEVLEEIEDPDIKEKLESLGKAILMDRK